MFIRSRVVKRATTLKKIRTKREGKEEDAMFARQGLISMCEIFNFVAPLFKDKRPVLFVYILTPPTRRRDLRRFNYYAALRNVCAPIRHRFII